MNGSSSGAKTSKLNASAPEWRPEGYEDNEDHRSLFLTFSNGFPLNEGQISHFFTKKYGACVERVYVHRGTARERRSRPPLFGKVTFKWRFIVKMVMSGEAKVCFRIDGRPLWCKSFDPSRLNNFLPSSATSSATSGEYLGGGSDVAATAE